MLLLLNHSKSFILINQLTFKVSISVPGIARKLLFKKREESHFRYFPKRIKVFTVLNIMGEPSIIFNIHHKKKLIHGNQEKKCCSIQGFYANLLYLWSGAVRPTQG